MHITSHGYWTHRLARRCGAPRPGWSALGAMVPDLPAGALTVGLRAAGRSWRAAGDEAFDPRFELVHRLMHAAAGPLALALGSSSGSRRRALALGWAGHLLVDLVSHHADARPPGWPLSARVWRSPISHWEPSHHAAAWNALDAMALAAAARTELPRVERLAATGAVAVAVAGLAEAIGGRPSRVRTPDRDRGADPGG
ncbi:MAG TPA: hypothetical protein VGV57_07750 [Thermoleophilaceae bacterium]|nr:hypothetical protein [Thermoleophilaceae bacterium]